MKPFRYHLFDLQQLVSFAEIARTGSFRQAAKTLHVAQPALSRQIKKLETALGVSLFDRAPHRLHLTLEGRELTTRLPSLFSQLNRLAETVGSAGTGGTGHLRVGDAGVLTTELLAPALRQLRKNWPDLRISFVQNTSQGFFYDLLEDTIDCAFPILQARRLSGSFWKALQIPRKRWKSVAGVISGSDKLAFRGASRTPAEIYSAFMPSARRIISSAGSIPESSPSGLQLYDQQTKRVHDIN
jgi:DNA-binding MarR family transcriptional regulator